MIRYFEDTSSIPVRILIGYQVCTSEDYSADSEMWTERRNSISLSVTAMHRDLTALQVSRIPSGRISR